MSQHPFAPARRRVNRRTPTAGFELGDRVLVAGQEGSVVGVRYGIPAYDVRINGVCLRNLAPAALRRSSFSGLIMTARPTAA